jgi:hypothetical protein
MQLGHAVKDVHRIGEPMAEADNVHQIKRTGLSSLLGVHEIGTTPI